MSQVFNGTTDYISWPSIIDLTAHAFTASFWVNCTGVNSYGNAYLFVANNATDTNYGIVMSYTTNRVSAIVNRSSVYMNHYCDGSGGGAVFNIVNAGWTHVVFTWDGVLDVTHLHLFKNGSEVAGGNSAGSGTETGSSGMWAFGGKTWGVDDRNYTGSLAELAVWSTVRDQSTITALASGRLPTDFSTNLVFYAPMRVSGDTTNTIGWDEATVHGTYFSSYNPAVDRIVFPIDIFSVVDTPTVATTSNAISINKTDAVTLGESCSKVVSEVVGIVLNIDHEEPVAWTIVDPLFSIDLYSTEAALGGTAHGLRVSAPGTDDADAYVYKLFSPTIQSGVLRGRFYFNLNNYGLLTDSTETPFLRMTNTNDQVVFAGHILKTGANSYDVKFIAYDDYNAPYAISYEENNQNSQEHCIEFLLVQASDEGMGDGDYRVWLDEELIYSDLYVYNFSKLAYIKQVMVGYFNTTPVTSGAFYFDEFILRNDSTYIGPRVQPLGILVAPGIQEIRGVRIWGG